MATFGSNESRSWSLVSSRNLSKVHILFIIKHVEGSKPKLNWGICAWIAPPLSWRLASSASWISYTSWYSWSTSPRCPSSWSEAPSFLISILSNRLVARGLSSALGRRSVSPRSLLLADRYFLSLPLRFLLRLFLPALDLLLRFLVLNLLGDFVGSSSIFCTKRIYLLGCPSLLSVLAALAFTKCRPIVDFDTDSWLLVLSSTSVTRVAMGGSWSVGLVHSRTCIIFVQSKFVKLL